MKNIVDYFNEAQEILSPSFVLGIRKDLLKNYTQEKYFDAVDTIQDYLKPHSCDEIVSLAKELDRELHTNIMWDIEAFNKVKSKEDAIEYILINALKK